MNYPAKEHEKQVIAKNNEDMETLAKFYFESASMAEFKVKAAAAGIHRRYMLMSFYVYYAAMNSTYSCANMLDRLSLITTAITVAVLLVVSISLWSLFDWSFLWLLCYLPFVVLIFAIISRILYGCFNYADGYITKYKVWR